MKKSSKKTFTAWFTGNVVANESFIRRIPVLVYICILMLLYMANGFRIQRRYNEVDQLTSSIKELRTVSFTTAAVRMQNSRQSEVEKRLQEQGLQLIYNTEPPKLIKPEK